MTQILLVLGAASAPESVSLPPLRSSHHWKGGSSGEQTHKLHLPILKRSSMQRAQSAIPTIYDHSGRQRITEQGLQLDGWVFFSTRIKHTLTEL